MDDYEPDEFGGFRRVWNANIFIVI
jgi:hypothetical protein